MDLRRLELDLHGRHARLTLADAAGVTTHALDGDAYATVESAAAPLLAALESTLGGACHLELQSIAIDPMERVVSVRGGDGERAWKGARYEAIAGASVGELARAAVAALGRKRGDRWGSPSEAAFWSRAYQEPTQGWEMMRAAPPLERWFGAHSPSGKRALVVGSGRGHEARLLAQLGARVVGVDFAPEAVTEARRLGEAGVEFRQRDLFTLAGESERYDLVVEHCCFCAIDPARRDEYVRVVHDVLDDNGELVGLFYSHGREGGPPFSVTKGELVKRFSPLFTVEHIEVPADSAALRAGQELLVHLLPKR